MKHARMKDVEVATVWTKKEKVKNNLVQEFI